jgi:hypothetical protein
VTQARLAELIESSRGDIRLCLNTLQFTYGHRGGGKTAAGKAGTKSVELSVTKDSRDDQSIFDALSTVLSLDSHSDGRGVVRKAPERVQRVVHSVQQRDDLDRFYQALFHNIYSVMKVNCSQVGGVGGGLGF